MLENESHTWTLFLDRDGVINQRPGSGYVCKPEQFIWLPQSLEAMRLLSGVFPTIVLVTNQQGIGKGYMQEVDLKAIHQHMLEQLSDAGARIDGIYHAAGIRAYDSFKRKPSPGMALQAKSDFPSINYNYAIMVGDTFTDMMFGKRLGMKTVFIAPGYLNFMGNYWPLIDYRFNSLYHFARFISKAFM